MFILVMTGAPLGGFLRIGKLHTLSILY